MSRKQNALWRFFASVKLALTSIFLIAATSIIGTVIQQGKAPAYYVEEYGEGLARIFQLLSVPDMYSSWWFVALLTLFAINLVVCSIERLPVTWRMMAPNDLAIDPHRLEKMNAKYRTETALEAEVVTDRMHKLLENSGWKSTKRLERGESTVLFAQKGVWTRFGAHIVHLSILVIFAGALIGSWFGFKANIYLPEGRSIENAFLRANDEPVPLGFEVYYDRFEMTHHPNGMVKEYRSDLIVYDPERTEPYEKSTIVNDPLNYRGISFYIADNFPIEEYFVQVRNLATGEEQAFRIPPDRKVTWPGTGVTFSIDELKLDQEGAAQQAMIRFSDDSAADPSLFWMNNKSTVTIERPGQEFAFSLRQLYFTWFMVAKDPGIWIVYLGCSLMMIGLSICFFLSHQRIWIYITSTKNQGSRILISGLSNKHQPAFERRFQELVARIQQDGPIATRAPKAEKPLKKRRAAA